MKKTVSAYPKTEATFRQHLSIEDIEHDSFNRPLRQCELRQCKGMCCYDGVYVNEEEEEVIGSVWRKNREFFSSTGVSCESEPIIETEWNGKKGRKTLVKSRVLSQIVDNFPTHFNNTACVFLTTEGYCSLQLLGVMQGKHKWYYKPLTCSLHPIFVSLLNKRVFLPTDETDPHNSEGYPGYTSKTRCGKICSEGPLATESLAEELQYLKDILLTK